MDKSIKITLIIVTSVIILALIGVYTIFQIMPQTGNTVNANGQSQIKATPDVVAIYFNVETNGTTAKEASDKNSEISDNLITALVKLGLERKQIQTQSYNVNENNVWEDQKYVAKGYKAYHYIKVELTTDKISQVGEVIDAGINAGALVNYINFELSQTKQNEYKAQALKAATEDAKIKAEAIASGLGKKVGGVVSISTSNFNYYPWPMYSYGGADMASSNIEAKRIATSITPSDQEINAQVTVVFRLK